LENQKGRDHSEDLGVDGEDNIRMNLKELEWEDTDWMHLTQDWDQWWVLVNAVMNLCVPLYARYFLTE
jgi:hypothetical protein